MLLTKLEIIKKPFVDLITTVSPQSMQSPHYPRCSRHVVETAVAGAGAGAVAGAGAAAAAWLLLGSVSCFTVGLLLFSLLGSSTVLELEPGAELSPP